MCVGAQTLLLEELVVRGQEEMFLPDPYENSGVIGYEQFNDSTPMIVTAWWIRLISAHPSGAPLAQSISFWTGWLCAWHFESRVQRYRLGGWLF